jgi:transcriptional regulator with XRE-family HTH domain
MKVSEIKPLLKARGLTQGALADHLGVSRVHVTQMLSGKRRMSVDTMNAIEALLADGGRQEAGVAETHATFAYAPNVRFVTLEEARRPNKKAPLSTAQRALLLRELREIGEAAKRLPRITDMTDDQILGYDEMK